MIVICDPNCIKHDHETFNLGFIHGVRCAWPDEEIFVLVDESHCQVLLNNAEYFSANIKNVSFRFIRLYRHEDFINVIWNCILMWKVIRFAEHMGARAVMFLTATPIQQRVIKYLGKNSKLIFTMNMHGDIDKLAYPYFSRERWIEQGNQKKKPFIKRVWDNRTRIGELLRQRVKNKIENMWDYFGKMTFPEFDLRKTLLTGNEENIRYVCLAKHISDGLPNYIDVSKINLRTITLPAVFHKSIGHVDNDILKIAIFGYGNSKVLYKLNCALEKQEIRNDYEIRIIGMDGRGTENFPHTTHPIQRVLKRREMETLAEDIDMFLILYEKERYVLSCSGSIIEAHQYGKPVIYLQNPCIDSFNPPDAPIGISCEDVEEMASVLARMINGYDAFKSELSVYQKNIMAQRKKIDIDNNLDRMRSLID